MCTRVMRKLIANAVTSAMPQRAVHAEMTLLDFTAIA